MQLSNPTQKMAHLLKVRVGIGGSGHRLRLTPVVDDTKYCHIMLALRKHPVIDLTSCQCCLCLDSALTAGSEVGSVVESRLPANQLRTWASPWSNHGRKSVRVRELWWMVLSRVSDAVIVTDSSNPCHGSGMGTCIRGWSTETPDLARRNSISPTATGDPSCLLFLCR